MQSAPRLRVAHLSSAHSARDPRIFEKECTTLATAGYDVTFVATGEPPEERGGVRIITRPPIKSRVRRIFLGPLWAWWQAMRLRPHIVHLHDPELIPLGLVVSLSKMKVVYDAHEDLVEQVEHKHYLGPTTRRLAAITAKLLLRLASQHFDTIVAATPHITRRTGSSKVVKVENFPVLDSFAPARFDAISSRRIVYVGALSRPRGLVEMIEAAKLLEDRGVSLHLAGPLVGDAQEVIDEAVKRPNIDYHGTLDRAGVADLLASCAAGLAIFHPVPAYLKGVPTKLYEYMASGLPSIVCDFPLLRAIVEKEKVGVVASPTSPEAIAEAVLVLLQDPNSAAAMGEKGRSWVETNRSWANEAQALLAAYKRLERP